MPVVPYHRALYEPSPATPPAKLFERANVRELGAASFFQSWQPWSLFSQPWAVRSGATEAPARIAARAKFASIREDCESTSGFHSSGTEFVAIVFVVDGRISMLTLPRAPPSYESRN